MTESTVFQNNAKTEVLGLTPCAVPDVIETTLGNRILVGAYQKLLLIFHLSASSNNDTLKILAGQNPPAFRSGIGDLGYTSDGGAKDLFMQIDTARFAADDGFIHITSPVHATLAGTIEVYGL